MINLLFEAVGEEIPIIGSIAAPSTTSAWIRGIDQLKTDLTENPELVHALQEKILSFLPEYVEAPIDSGASLAMIHDWAVGYRSQPLTLQQYQEFVLPYQQELFIQLRKRKVPTILWMSNTRQVFDGMIKSKANMISVDAKTDLGDAKRKAEGKTGLYGNLDPRILHQNAQTIEEAVKECMKKMAPGREYVFSTEGRVVDAPILNVLLMVELVKRFGKFPIDLQS